MPARYCHEAIVLHILPTPWAPANLHPTIHHLHVPACSLCVLQVGFGSYMTHLIGAQPKCQNPFYHHSLYPISTLIIPTLFPIHFHSPLKEIQNFPKSCALGYGDPTQTMFPPSVLILMTCSMTLQIDIFIMNPTILSLCESTQKLWRYD